MDGTLNLGMDWSQLSAMAGPALQKELSQKLSPQQLQALHETEAYITQQGCRISVDIKFKAPDEDTEAVIKNLLLGGLMRATPQLIKMFHVRTFARKLEEEGAGPQDAEPESGQGGME